MNSIKLLVFCTILAFVGGVNIVHRLDYSEKITIGKQVHENFSVNSDSSSCWRNATENIKDKCTIKDEKVRIELAASFTHCTLFTNPCINVFPTQYW